MRSIVFMLVACLMAGLGYGQTFESEFNSITLSLRPNNNHSCCQYPNPLIVNDEALESLCPVNIAENNSTEFLIVEYACQTSCYLKELNLLDGDVLNVDRFYALIDNNTAKNEEANKFYYNKLKYCIDLTKQLEKTMVFHVIETREGCSMVHFSTIVCLASSIVLDCPVSRQVDSIECESTRATMGYMFAYALNRIHDIPESEMLL